MLSHYLLELASLMAVFSFAVVAPGADTAMVMRQSLIHGRRAGIFTAFGIGTSLLFHMSYTILGLGLVVSQSLLLFSIIKWAGAIYLAYIGVMAFRAPPPVLPEAGTIASPDSGTSGFRSFSLGFITNALNPKAILFFLSLFSTLVSHETPVVAKAAYGLVMATTLILWFSAVSCFLTMPQIRAGFVAAGRWINRVTGLVFIAFSIRLALARAD